MRKSDGYRWMVGLVPIIARVPELSRFPELEGKLVRMVVALLEYGQSQHYPKRPFPPVPPNIHQSLRDFLALSFRINMNVEMPDSLENIWTGDMRVYCSGAWEELKRDEVGATKTAFKDLWLHMLRRLCLPRAKKLDPAKIAKEIMGD